MIVRALFYSIRYPSHRQDPALTLTFRPVSPILDTGPTFPRLPDPAARDRLVTNLARTARRMVALDRDDDTDRDGVQNSGCAVVGGRMYHGLVSPTRSFPTIAWSGQQPYPALSSCTSSFDSTCWSSRKSQQPKLRRYRPSSSSIRSVSEHPRSVGSGLARRAPPHPSVYRPRSSPFRRKRPFALPAWSKGTLCGEIPHLEFYTHLEPRWERTGDI